MTGVCEVYQRAERAVSRVVDGETVIVQPGQGMVSITNEVGSYVWDLLDGNRAVPRIVDDVCDAFDVERPRAQEDILAFIGELRTHQLIVPCATGCSHD
ncbi:MAG: PqqD family protein [Spartobacteria bacterium]|nr:PqqD family protein [Spartobacteria bacterium]